MQCINKYYGIIMSIRDCIVIELPRGGKITAPTHLGKGIKIGELVSFLLDPLNTQIVSIMPKKEADKIVKKGVSHLYETADRDPYEEELDAKTTEIEWDESVFWCPDLG